LVDRHRPNVLHRCRQILYDGHDVEDALQATFLVLLQKIASIRRPELLGPWLSGVADRIAVRLRSRNFQRRRRERQFVEMLPGHLPPDAIGHELRLTIHEELSRLPDKYRLPIVLCYWEGLTHEETADRLALPVGTVKTRLVRGRNVLRGRLNRHGLSVESARARRPFRSIDAKGDDRGLDAASATPG
jgi:polysaccharide export outer membrane protein